MYIYIHKMSWFHPLKSIISLFINSLKVKIIVWFCCKSFFSCLIIKSINLKSKGVDEIHSSVIIWYFLSNNIKNIIIIINLTLYYLKVIH